MANPTTAGVSSVPERTSRSCPPPCSNGATGRSRRTTRAPTPWGPPILCPETVIASTPEAAKSTGTAPTACTASVWTGMPCSLAAATTRSSGWSVPTSLLAHITETRPTPEGSARAASSAAGSSRPAASTARCSTAKPCRSSSHSSGSSTAWCSTAVVSNRVRRGSASRRAQARPLSARLSASVPPEVNTTSPGRQPRAAATRSRASSTARLAARPEACNDEGLAARPSCSTIASSASGTIGVVAAWSR